MTLSEELQWRGFVQQTTFKNLNELDKRKWTFYHGFDASADSQTVGNLAAMMFDKVFIRHGHKAILLAGGATSLVGDPGGKDKERPLQDEAVIASNVKKAEAQLKQIFGKESFTLVNNLDWTKNLTLLDFLRDIGKHFSMTPLVQRDYIAQRIGEGGAGISFTEFSYTLLQGMDFLHLFDKHGATLQLGGSDQWGNCLSGVELIRKTRGEEAHVITLPLIINKATGKKFGKSEEGAVWLDSTKTSPFKFYQFWINADDGGVEDYLKVYTELDKDTIDSLMIEHKNNPGSRAAQKRLAYEVTKIVHGDDRAESVKSVSEVLFGGMPYSSLNAGAFKELETELPVYEAKLNETTLVDIILGGNLASSKTEARRFLEENAIYINGAQIPLSKNCLDEHDNIQGYAVVRRGKNASVLVKLN
mgnify:CR=1 FL=1